MKTQMSNQLATEKAIQLAIMDVLGNGIPTNKVAEYVKTATFEKKVSDYKKLMQTIS